MYSIYGCPMHYGLGDEGLMYSLDYLNQYYDLNIPVVPEITVAEQNIANLKNLNSVAETCRGIARYQRQVIMYGDAPLFITGDHSAVIGSVSGTSSCYDNLGLIWIDAHSGLNTADTTVTGHIHGMSVAALLGIGDKTLTNILTPGPKLKPENIVMLGLRSIDPPEQRLLDELNIKYYTYEDVCRIGIHRCIDQSIQYLSRLKAVQISFDLDAMNPVIIPGVSNPAKDGFTKHDISLMLETFQEELPIVAADVSGFNIVHDEEDRTSEFLFHLIERVFELNEEMEDILFYGTDSSVISKPF